MSVSPLFSARGACARSGAALLVLAAVACDTNTPSADSTAAASLNGVGMVLDLPTVALTLGAAGSTLHAVRPTTQGMDTVAAAWHSSDEQIVSVDNAGHLTARGAGNALVWARAGRDSVSSAVTVSPAGGPSFTSTAAAVSIRPAVATLAVGAPTQFSASVQAPVSAGVTTTGTAASPTVTWTSSAPNVAAVSSSGRVIPIAPGIALITATALGARATSAVVVMSSRSAASKVDLAVMRFDGGSGSVMVSNGIPFPRGLVTDSTLSQVHLFVNGVEQRLFTRALGGRWPDGSLRAALVQFDYTVPDARPIPAYFTVGGARTLAAPAERAATPTPVAAALPTAPAYLISTGIGGTLYDPSTTRSATTLIAQYESDYARLAAADWAQCGASWSCGRTAGYDRAFTLYQAWVRTADPTYWQHATAIAADYVSGYLVPTKGAIAAWWSLTESTALQYWATGDERTRGYLDAVSSELIYQVRPEGGWGLGTVPAQYGDDRDRAKVLIALMDARMIDAKPTPTGTPRGGDTPFFAAYKAAHPLADAVSLVLSSQQASGAFGGTYYLGGQKNYMVGMLLTALVRYYEEVTPDARIQPAVKRAVDYMFATQWHADVLGMPYCSVDHGADCDGGYVFSDLNNLIVPSVAWYYSRTGDATYATRVDQMLQGATSSRSWWASSGKSFDQAYYRMFNVIAWRNR